MIGWYVQDTMVGGRPAAVNLTNGAYIVVSENELDDPNQITADEIIALARAVRPGEHCPMDAMFANEVPAPVIQLRLFRFGMMNEVGEITPEGETALAHITFERNGITAFSDLGKVKV